MARPFLKLSMQGKLPFLSMPVSSFFIVLGCILSIFSVVTFLCSSHNSDKSQGRRKFDHSLDKKMLSKLNNNITTKASSMAKMISWRKETQVEDEEDGDDGDAIWRKRIIMGERCRPLDISGQIQYDSDGNLIPESSSGEQNKKVVPLETC